MEDSLTEYREKLQSMGDDEFVDEVESKVWLSAFAANNGRSKHHAQCDATYDEARRREKLWLYQRGWNAAYVSCGYHLDTSDIARASPNHPSYAKEPTP